MFRNMLKYTGLCLTVALATSCHSSAPDTKITGDVDSVETAIENIKKAKSIFYRMYLPSEMYKVFEKTGASYAPDILNPVENVNLYETSAKAALNLGVYGVDLSYNKMFGQNQKTLLYFTVIHKLAQQLGIPDNQFTIALRKIEKNISNRDSLSAYATDLYASANTFLNDNERQSTAALILTGGWIEALHITSAIANDNAENSQILERIIFQKYSLATLISLLNNYQSDEVVNRYLIMLKSLNRIFDKFNIYYESNDLSIDTINKLINANKIQVDIDQASLHQIKEVVNQIRTEIIK